MKKIVLSIVYFLFLSTLIYAQTTVTGKVTDASGEPLPGVNVFITGTTTGTITGPDGTYSLSVNDINNTELTFSFIGFEHKVVKLNGQTKIDVVLKEQSTNLGEVVIHSYGAIKKSDLTGSVSSVKIETNQPPTTTVDQMLQGHAAGVTVSTSSAEPGAAINVRIRGLNSISVSNQPLYVIDGIPMDVDNATPNSMGEDINKTYSPLIGLNPSDIESVEILKDASATAIYGSRGANGVVLITTKGGKKKGKSEITFSTSVTLSSPSEEISVLNPRQFAEFRNEYELVSARINGEVPNLPYNGSETGPLPQDVTGYNWQDEIMRTALSQDYNLSMTGATKNANYYLSFGAMLADGIVKNSSLDRYIFNGKYNWDITSKLRYNLSMSFSHAEGRGTATSTDANTSNTAINWMLLKSPLADEYTGDNDFVDPEYLETANPLTFINEYISEPVNNYFRGRITLNYDVTKWLTLEGKYGLNYTHNKKAQYWPQTLPMVEGLGRAGYGTSDQLSWTMNALAHFKFNINKNHKINGVAGIEMNKRNLETFKVSGTGFPDDALYYYNLESASIFTPADLDHVASQLFSGIARINYSYRNKYLVTVTGRYDGSSRFSEDQKYAFFPSASVAWRVTQEEFLKNNDILSNLKLRLSWGQAGNQGLQPYATLARYNSVIYPLNGVSTSGYAVADFKKSVTWETSEQLNAGVDLGFINSRFNLSIDVYKKKSKDLLILRNMPLSSGYTVSWDNLGQINNTGVDIEAMFRVINTRFKWDLGGNFSKYNNEIVKLGLPESSYGYVQFWGKTISGFWKPVNTYIEGQPVGQFWGYRTDGLFQTQQEVDELEQAAKDKGFPHYQFGKSIAPGDIKYVDLNGDGAVNDQDQEVIGDPNPDFTYGITNNFSYKNFSLNIFFTGVSGVDVFNANLLKLANVGQANTNVLTDAYTDAWRGEGTSDYWPRIVNNWKQNRLEYPSDRLVEKGSYFRLQNATLAYNTSVKSVRWISNLNISVTGVNLFTITDYSWWNPEANAYGNNNMAMGIDVNSYPLARSVVFGLRISFK